MGVMHKNTPTSGLGNPAAAAETAVYTTPVLQTGQGDGIVGIAGTLNVTPGTSATVAVIRLRQGNGLAGTQIGPSFSHTVAAGAPQSITFGFTDLTNWLEQAGGGQYTLTLQMTGGAATSTVNVVDIEVIV